MKTRIETAADVSKLEDVPNIGREIAKDLRDLGIEAPAQLAGRDPYEMYERLCAQTGVRHDPCVLDTFIAAVCFMEGGPKVPWYAFTAERKKTLSDAAKARA
jgi:hypothetical protein